MSTSLLEVIRTESQKRGKKLKIVCDWDDCLQPLKAALIYEFGQGELGEFKKFFDRFWENNVTEGSFSNASGNIRGISNNEKEEKAIKKFVEMKRKMKKDPEAYTEFAKTFYGTKKRFSFPFTSIAEELLIALKEDLVEELLVISSFRWEDNPEDRKIDEADNEGKRQKVFRSFQQFPQCTAFELTEVAKSGKDYVPYRHERIRALCPDFDLFIDDNKRIVKETMKAFADQPEKLYVLPNYKSNRDLKGPNVRHIETTVSDLKDEDFEKAAQEYQAKKAREQAQKIQEAQRAERKKFWTWTTGLVGGGLLIGLVAWLIIKKLKKPK